MNSREFRDQTKTLADARGVVQRIAVDVRRGQVSRETVALIAETRRLAEDIESLARAIANASAQNTGAAEEICDWMQDG